MKVRELIEKLKEMPQDNIVLYDVYPLIPEYRRAENVIVGFNEYDGVVFISEYIEEEDC